MPAALEFYIKRRRNVFFWCEFFVNACYLYVVVVDWCLCLKHFVLYCFCLLILWLLFYRRGLLTISVCKNTCRAIYRSVYECICRCVHFLYVVVCVWVSTQFIIGLFSLKLLWLIAILLQFMQALVIHSNVCIYMYPVGNWVL